MGMNKNIILSIAILLTSITHSVFTQGRPDAEVITSSNRRVDPVNRVAARPQAFDTVLPAPQNLYPLLAVRAENQIAVNEIDPAIMKIKPNLSKLYNGYARLGAGNRLMGLAEVYYGSLRHRRMNWGVNVNHLSEWGQLADFAPSQYDITDVNTFLDIRERGYTYGGSLNYRNQGLHYYGFRNPDAPRDSIHQRFNNIQSEFFYHSHQKDTAHLNYRIGVKYHYINDRKPKNDTFNLWRAQEHYLAVQSNWKYRMSNHLLLSNLAADFDVFYNNYRYGIRDTSIAGFGDGFIQQNTLIQLRPYTSFYSLNNLLQFKFGGELSIDVKEQTRAFLYPIAEAQYSLFNDLFIPYVSIAGGVHQQRFESFTRTNEFIRSNIHLENLQRLQMRFGLKGTLSKKMSFNVGAQVANNRNFALFINDTVFSAGNQFNVIYDTVTVTSLQGSLSYQWNEKIKIDGILTLFNYQLNNNPYAWNLPTAAGTLRGKYNMYDRLIFHLDLTVETGRRARVFNPGIPNITNDQGVLSVPLGVLVDGNLSAEFRYNKRMSFFANMNNFAAQRYQRWFDYPVQGFQFMLGATFRF